MSDEFLFQEFSKQGTAGQKKKGPNELHSMPKPPQMEEEEMPAEMLSIIEEGKQRIRSMLRNGKSCENIATLTNIPLDYIQTIQKEMGSLPKLPYLEESKKNVVSTNQ